MNSVLKNLFKKLQLFIALIFLIYLTVTIFFIEIPAKIFDLWNNMEWWSFIITIGVVFFATHSISTILIKDYIVEISPKTKKVLSNGLGGILLTLIGGIFNFKNDDAILISLIFIPFTLFFYLNLTIMLDKILDFSYKKGWYDGYKDRITGYYGKSYEDGLNDGYNFNRENNE